jgi:hypothetical protein
MVDIQWADGEQLAELLDVITGRCTLCGEAAKVPEDVLAVATNGPDDPHPVTVIVCEACQPNVLAMMIGRKPGMEGPS